MQPDRVNSAVRDFLKRHLLDADSFCREELLDRFLSEMETVRNGGAGSVKMIPAWIGHPVSIRKPVSVTAIDIGGTNVRSTVVTMDDQGIKSLDRLPAFPTPGVGEELPTREFFRRIVSGVEPHLQTGKICICFSLANIPQKDRDAVVAAGAKQVNVPDLLGQRVGQCFREAAASLGLPNDQEITVINDTVAAALGGWSENRAGRCSGFIGFIYGTGTNIAYPEPTGEIVNIESGAYCAFPTGDIDDRYDAMLIDAGYDRFEKMVAGGYQGGLMTCILQTAAEEALLSRSFAERLFVPGETPLTAADISAFSRNPSGENRIAAACEDDRERAILCNIFDAVTERSALLCSVTLTGAMLRSGIGRSPNAPVFITAEGSTYLKQKGFRELLERDLAEAGRKYGLFYMLQHVPDAVLKGTAIAAISE